MRLIVISDLHHRYQWVESYLAAQTFDAVIFLGDYFDGAQDSPEQAQDTARWLKESLRKPNRVHLLGNHDVWYGYGCPFARCGENTDAKKEAINAVLTADDWEQLGLCHQAQGFLFSHAGVHARWFTHSLNGVTVSYIQKVCGIGRKNLLNGNPDPIFMAGQARGGGYGRRPGGITWLDFNREFQPIHGLNQIVGHTAQATPESDGVVKWSPNKLRPRSTNYCVDFRNKWVTMVDDGTVTFEKSPLHPEQANV